MVVPSLAMMSQRGRSVGQRLPLAAYTSQLPMLFRDDDVAAIERAVRTCVEHGFKANVDFLLGLPGISGRNEKVSGWQPSRDSLLRLHKVSVKP